MNTPYRKSRLELVKQGFTSALNKRGRLIVGLDRLLEDPKNERKVFRNMDALVASIQTVGLVEPITVTAEDGQYRILTGHRRARAAKLAGISEVEVIIREPETDTSRRLKSLVSNVQREDIGPVELAEALKSLLADGDEIGTQRELARMLGKRESWVSDMLRILTLPVHLLQRLKAAESKLPYDNLMRIARLEDLSEQEKLVELALNGGTQVEVRSRLRDVSKSSSTRTRKNLRVSETTERYSAQVSGPNVEGARAGMVAAVSALLEKLSGSTFDS